MRCRSSVQRENCPKRIVLSVLAIVTSLLVILSEFEKLGAKEQVPTALPPMQVHPLPPSLAQWQDAGEAGDYFLEVKPTPVGYLVWSELPVKVYIERPADPIDSSASTRQFLQWVDAVLQAVEEWNVYFPLAPVQQPESADIIIERSRPPLKAEINRETGLYDIARVRSAQTRYELYLHSGSTAVLSHRMIVQISPGRSHQSTIAATRHELGHALGVWGHSPDPTDVMYFSQVRNPSPISWRDINTLKRIYQQPTRLGWTVQR